MQVRANVETSTATGVGLFWLLPGRLGGTARPGLKRPLEEDLDELEGAGVTLLVNLEEQATVDLVQLGARGLSSVRFPILDMSAPTVRGAEAFAARIKLLLARGEVIVLHCRAGLGRTGTMLAALLVVEGLSAVDAISSIRALRAYTVQSEAQVEFLHELERHMRARRASRPRSARDELAAALRR